MAKDITGTYIELTPEMIDDGNMMKVFGQRLRDAMKRLDEYERASESTKVKVKVSLEIVISRQSAEYFGIDYDFAVKTPKLKKTALARGGSGRLLADPDAKSLNDHDQMVMTFDRFGNLRGKVNPETGEVADDEPAENPSGSGAVVGRVDGSQQKKA